MSTSTTPTFITEMLALLFNYSSLNDCYSEVTDYTVLAYSYWDRFYDAYECQGCIHQQY